ncbi:unnamed protein product [Cochlearia groenlandica]
MFGELPKRLFKAGDEPRVAQINNSFTGFNCKEAPSINEISDWEDDNGFWSKLLQNKGKINIKTLIKEHLSVVKNWRKVDIIRFGLWKPFQLWEIFWEKKIYNSGVRGPLCSNWTGAAKVSYDEIIQLENTFGVICSNSVNSTECLDENDKQNLMTRVLKMLMSRMKVLLCERGAVKQEGLGEDMKSFIQEIVDASFSSLEGKLEKKINDRMSKLDSEFTELKKSLLISGFTCNKEKSTSANPSTTNIHHEKMDESEDEVTTNVPMNVDNLFFREPSNIDENLGTQEYLKKTVGVLSQDTYVTGFDPIPTYEVDEKIFFRPVKIESPELHNPYVVDKFTKKLFTDTKMTDSRR